MAGCERRIGRLAAMIAVSAIGLGACARHEYQAMGARSYGSLKDDYPAARRHAAKSDTSPGDTSHKSMTARGADPEVLPAIRRAHVETPPPPDLSKRAVKPVEASVVASAPAPAAAPASAPAAAPPPAPPAPSEPKQAMAPVRSEPAPAPAPQPAEPKSVAPQAPQAPQAQINSARSAPPPAPPAESKPLDAKAVEALLAEGRKLFDEGRVVELRRRFIAAMSGPMPDVLLALARSYDTYYLSRLPSADAAPDMQRALVLYERAVERGSIEANADLERTRTILKIPR